MKIFLLKIDQVAESPEVEVDRLVPQHLLEEEPLLGPLLATQRPNTEVFLLFLLLKIFPPL